MIAVNIGKDESLRKKQQSRYGEKTQYPKREKGYFHLTPCGWVRQDRIPFPNDRCETWLYEMEWPHEDAKEHVTLTKVWVCPNFKGDDLRSRFGDAVVPTTSRNVTLGCQV